MKTSKAQDELQIARDAASAAALIKATAETTATSINIQNIQGDISEIKQSLKELSGVFATKVEVNEIVKIQIDHENRIRLGEQNNWKYVGASSVVAIIISAVLPLILKLFIK